MTIDTWRWDHLGVAGTGKVETPNLDRLAREGLYIARVQSTCPLTTPAHATILTGLEPHEHGIRDNRHFTLAPGVVTLPSRFREAGYATGAVVSAAPLRRGYGLDRGFDHYDDLGLGIEGDNALVPSSRPAAATTDRALAWLDGLPADKPRFLWVHYYDPHEPYDPPAPWRQRYPGRPYAGEVAYADSQIGRLIDRARLDRTRSWVIAVTGDHGEALGEHGESTHGVLLYGSTVDVPLILWTGRNLAAGRGPFGLVDVSQALAELAGLGPSEPGGASILDGSHGERWLAAETAYPALAFGLGGGRMLRRGNLVFLDQGVEEVFDTAEDPGQQRNLVDDGTVGLFLAQARVEAATRFGPDWDLFKPSLSLPAHEVQALRALGYLGGHWKTPKPRRRMDLRRFAADLSAFQASRASLGAGRFAEALRGYDRFLGLYPDAALAWQERGQALAAMGRLEAARESFERALALDPADAVSSLNLGNLAVARGDHAQAERYYLGSLAAEEGQPEAHLNLALLYVHKVGRPKEAGPHLERFLQLAPDDPEAPAVRRLAAGI